MRPEITFFLEKNPFTIASMVSVMVGLKYFLICTGKNILFYLGGGGKGPQRSI